VGPPALKLVEGGLVPVNSASAPSPRRPLPQYASLPPIADRRGGWDVPTNCAGDLALTRPHSLDAFVPPYLPALGGRAGTFPPFDFVSGGTASRRVLPPAGGRFWGRDDLRAFALRSWLD